MKNTRSNKTLALLVLLIFLGAAIPMNAAPVRFKQVVQIINAKPGKAGIGSFTQLHLATDVSDVNDSVKAVPSNTPTEDGRVIVTTSSEMVEAEDCACAAIPPIGGGFPKWTLLGLGAVPFLFLIPNDDDPTPTPTPTNTPPGTQTPTPTPTNTPTPTPTLTPTPTPTVTPTPTPTNTPPITPTPEPVPEPMTILLFGTGLAGIGAIVRKRRQKRKKDDSAFENQ